MINSLETLIKASCPSEWIRSIISSTFRNRKRMRMWKQAVDNAIADRLRNTSNTSLIVEIRGQYLNQSLLKMSMSS
jgi:hypothetical protein